MRLSQYLERPSTVDDRPLLAEAVEKLCVEAVLNVGM